MLEKKRKRSEDGYCKNEKSATICRSLVLYFFCCLVLVFTGRIFYAVISSYDNNKRDFTASEVLKTHRSIREVNDQASNQKEPITLNDINNRAIYYTLFPGKWAEGKDGYLIRDEASDVIIYHDMIENKDSILFSFENLELDNPIVHISPDMRYALLAYSIHSVYRHSTLSKYKILSIETNQTENFPKLKDVETSPHIQYASFTSKEGRVIFVYKNNLYYQDEGDEAVQVTFNGHPTDLFNGCTDWLYEEEILATDKAAYASPDGEKICYASFMTQDIPYVQYPLYGDPNNPYTKMVKFKYPKAGSYLEKNEKGIVPTTQVMLYIYDIESNQTLEIPSPTESVYDNGFYYVHVSWADTSHVMIVWTNREQNYESFQYCNVDGSIACNEIYSNKYEKGWININGGGYPVPIYDSKKNCMYTILSKKISDESGAWPHIAKLNLKSEGKSDIEWLTDGEQQITTILSLDVTNDQIYYLGTNGDSTEKHIMRVSANYDASNRADLINVDKCLFSSALISPSATYAIIHCLGPEVPFSIMRDLSDMNSTDVLLEENKPLREYMESKQIPTRKFFKMRLSSGYEGVGEYYLPFNHKEGDVHPLLLHTYAGPSSKMVTKTFSISGSRSIWFRSMQSRYNVVIASFDGRGTSGSGDKMQFEIYKNSSLVEIEDQLQAVQYLMNEESFIDKSKNNAMFGWSYGGYITAATMANDYNNIIKCGAAVAPVTDFAYYDTAYTERFLGLYDEKVYEKTRVFRDVTNFHKKKFYLAHGTNDDNVHFKNSAMLIKALTAGGVDFKQEIFIDQNHGIRDLSQYLHLLSSIETFLAEDCWEINEESSETDSNEMMPFVKKYIIIAAVTSTISIILILYFLIVTIVKYKSCHKTSYTI